jgi:hypothetical protein
MKRPDRRSTRPSYEQPGSFARVLEAVIAVVDAPTEDDRAYHAAEISARQAIGAHAPRILGAKGGRASAQMLTAEQRRDKARRAAQARWSKQP